MFLASLQPQGPVWSGPRRSPAGGWRVQPQQGPRGPSSRPQALPCTGGIKGGRLLCPWNEQETKRGLGGPPPPKEGLGKGLNSFHSGQTADLDRIYAGENGRSEGGA